MSIIFGRVHWAITKKKKKKKNTQKNPQKTPNKYISFVDI